MDKKTTVIKVRGYHLDFYQHVNNARYLEFIEEARWAFFEDARLIETLLAQKLGFIIVNINIGFRRGAVLNDILEIKTTFDTFGRKSGNLKQIIYLQGTNTVVCEADITYVIVDLNQNKAISLNDDLRLLLENSAKS